MTKSKNPNDYIAQQKRAKRRKAELIALKGGKCSVCGYSRNTAALCFHHLRDKKFGIDSRHISNTTWEKLLAELEKCILVCHNCHAEIHHPQCGTN